MANATDFQDRRRVAQAVIGAGAALSGSVDLAGCDLVAIQMPAAWTAANLTFQASSDGATFNDLHDATGTEVSITAAASQFLFLTPDNWLSVRYLKVRSGTSAVPVNQVAAATLQLVCRPVK